MNLLIAINKYHLSLKKKGGCQKLIVCNNGNINTIIASLIVLPIDAHIPRLCFEAESKRLIAQQQTPVKINVLRFCLGAVLHKHT